MSSGNQGSVLLEDEKLIEENSFDIFSLPPKETHMKYGKTISIASTIPITDSGMFYSPSKNYFYHATQSFRSIRI